MTEFKQVVSWVAKIFLLVALCVWLLGTTPLGRDDTDPGSWGARSGMALYTDALTGCQYLGKNNSLTPRVDKNGKHLGCF